LDGLEEARELLEASRRILVFTGAGISTESGVPDFRGPDGLWTKVDPDDFHIDRYLSRRDLRVNSWQMHLKGERWGSRGGLVPNRGHEAVVELWRAGRISGVVTQNVDGLHQAAGLPEQMLVEVHGNVRQAKCLGCGSEWPTETILVRVEQGDQDPHCTSCGGIVKTKVVMFGEELDVETMSRAFVMLAEADAVLVLGSTVAVFPASDIVLRAAMKPIPILIINLGETEADHLASVRLEGSIGDLLPDLVAGLPALE